MYDPVQEEKATRKMRRFQCTCDHHREDHTTSFVCSTCGLWMDNLRTCTYIKYLEQLLEQNEIPYNQM